MSDHAGERAGAAHTVLWTGRSGRRYTMTYMGTSGASLATGRFYALADDGVIRWAGMADDLIADQASRGRFRSALARGATLLAMPAPDDDLARMTLVWDLEGTHRFFSRDAA